MQRLVLFIESLVVVRKMQHACDLIELSLKRLQSRRVPKTKTYKRNINEEKQKLANSIEAVHSSV